MLQISLGKAGRVPFPRAAVHKFLPLALTNLEASGTTIQLVT